MKYNNSTGLWRRLLAYLACFLAGWLLMSLFGKRASAADIPAKATVGWILPTKTTDGLPLTGPLALTAIKAWFSLSPIADTAMTTPPSVSIAPDAGTYPYTMTAPVGAKIYVRLAACHALACSMLSSEAFKIVVATAPLPPTNVTIDIVIVTP